MNPLVSTPRLTPRTRIGSLFGLCIGNRKRTRSTTRLCLSLAIALCSASRQAAARSSPGPFGKPTVSA